MQRPQLPFALLPSAGTSRRSSIVCRAVLSFAALGCVDSGAPPPPLTGINSLAPTIAGANGTPLVVEAEAGQLGSDWVVSEDPNFPGLSFVSAGVNVTDAPTEATDSRITSTEVTFPEPGQYQLLVRFRIGPDGGNDDSFFVNTSTGDEANWQVVNSLGGITVAGEQGYTPGAIVAGTGGNSTSGVWKWTVLDDFTYEVPEGELTRTFQFASREDGLDLDKFAFSIVGDGFTTGYTTDQLDAGEQGVQVFPPELPPDYEPPADQLPLAVGAAGDKWLGMVCCGNQRPFLENYFNQITPENAGKWGSVEATRDVYNWDALDEARDLAVANNMPFRFHVLLWGSQQPDWIEELPPEEQLIEIRQWMEAVNERYGEDIDFLEVTNEFSNQPPTEDFEGKYTEALGGAGESGFDWVIEGFRMAREIFPATAQLMLNEYSVINSDELTATYINLVELLQAEDLIDAIGVQGHAFSTRGSEVEMSERIDQLGSTGLSVYITEMDIDGPPGHQLIDYQRLFTTFWENPNVGGITLWGYRDGMWRTNEDATLVYNNGAEKPALRWLKGYLGETSPLVEGPTTITVGTDATDLGSFTVTAADASAVPDTAEVAWNVAWLRNDDALLSQSVKFAEGTSTLQMTTPLPAGTYGARVYADVDAVVSNLYDVQIVVE